MVVAKVAVSGATLAGKALRWGKNALVGVAIVGTGLLVVGIYQNMRVRGEAIAKSIEETVDWTWIILGISIIIASIVLLSQFMKIRGK